MGLSSWQPWWHYFAVWPVGPNTSISSFLCFNIWWYFQKSVWCSNGIDYVIGAWCKADTKHISCWCFYQNCYWTAPIFVHFCIRSDISGCTQMICPVTLTILQSDRSVSRRVRLDSFVGAISVRYSGLWSFNIFKKYMCQWTIHPFPIVVHPNS